MALFEGDIWLGICRMCGVYLKMLVGSVKEHILEKF